MLSVISSVRGQLAGSRHLVSTQRIKGKEIGGERIALLDTS